MQLQRKGYPLVSDKILQVLRQLAHGEYETVTGVHKRTLNAMQDHDLILQSKAYPSMFIITGRGKRCLTGYAKQKRRRDGICKICGVNPRGYYSSGVRKAYCDNCIKAIQREKYARHGHQLAPNRKCSRCRARPCAQLPNGDRITYCAVCRSEMRKEERARKMARKFAQINAGNPPLCCVCKAPVYYTPKVVYDYCHTCYRAQQNRYCAQKKAERMNKLIRGL